jgi:hypothetical protein
MDEERRRGERYREAAEPALELEWVISALYRLRKSSAEVLEKNPRTIIKRHGLLMLPGPGRRTGLFSRIGF